MKPLDQLLTENSAFVIFAAQPRTSTEVMKFFVDNKIPFKVLLGSWENEQETSYCVPVNHFDAVLNGLPGVSQQESILVLGAYNAEGLRAAEIVYLDPEKQAKMAGFIVNVTRDEAFMSSGWTFDPMSDTYFTLRTKEEIADATKAL